MSNLFYLVWFIFLILGFVFLGTRFLSDQGQNKDENLTTNTIDSLFTNQSYTGLITIGYGECQICDELLNREFYKDLDVPKCYLDIIKSLNNRLLGQALHAKGFPTTYVVNNDCEIMGVIEGMYNFQPFMDSILYFQRPICDVSIRHVEKDSTLAMLSYSFQALLNYWKEDYAGMKTKAQTSLEKGSYFFNNYLMYLYYKNENKRDSVLWYKKRALKQSGQVNSFIYSDLIEKLKQERE